MTIPNSESRLLALPAELRLTMWKLLLSGNVFHANLVIDGRTTQFNSPQASKPANKKLYVSVCNADPDDTYTATAIRRCTDVAAVADYSERHSRCDSRAYRGTSYSLALLRTCLLIHADTVLLPFQTNIFSFGHMVAFNLFRDYLYPDQRTAISSIILDHYIDFNQWKVFNDLTGLKKVTIFNATRGHSSDSEESRRSRLHKRCRRMFKELDVFEQKPFKSAVVCVYVRNPEGPVGLVEPSLAMQWSKKMEDKLLGAAVEEEEEEEQEEEETYGGPAVPRSRGGRKRRKR